MAPSNGPQDLASPAIIKIIDELFKCNINKHIHLPQLVVVGNQSSGKSSVLEGISKLPFPKDSGLCTRFATQITFRRSEITRTKVSIVPGPDSDAEHKIKCKNWTSSWDGQNKRAFAQIIIEAQKVMGIRAIVSDGRADSAMAGSPSARSGSSLRNDSGALKNFSEDVLSLEIQSPDQGHFSIIDVPGIFKVATEGKTTRDDVELVENMVKRYVSNPRSIILAVVPANVDLATEEILKIAEQHDPQGLRTIGVLTKPDLVDKGAEKGIIEVLQGRRHKLRHGWGIVRNLGQKEAEDCENRDELEAHFFETEIPWKTVAKKKVGIVSLRERLQKLLQAHTEREFPEVKTDLEAQLISTKEELESLGPVRGSAGEQRSYLIAVAMAFQDLVKKADARHYSADSFFDNEAMRLKTAIANRGDDFDIQFKAYGHQHEFDDIPGIQGNDPSSDDDEEELPPIDTRQVPNPPGLRGVLAENVKVMPPQKGGIMKWLEEVFRRSRGLETVGDAMLATTLAEQSNNWNAICAGYISDVIAMVHKFMLNLLNHVCTDEHVRRGLYSLVENQIMDKYRLVLRKVERTLFNERMKTPSTQNGKFNDLLQTYRAKRLVERVFARSFIPNTMGSQERVVRLRDIETSFTAMSNRKYNIQQMHDTLKAYYEIAYTRAIDTIIKQDMESSLLPGEDAGSPTPLEIFEPKWVNELTSEQLGRIAGEDSHIMSTRDDLKQQIKELERAKLILQNA